MAYYFNGSSNDIQYARLTGAGLASCSEFTISAWHYPLDNNLNRSLITYSDGNPDGSYTHQIMITSAGAWMGYIYTGSLIYLTWPGSVVPGSWQHLALTGKTNGNCYFYFNGNLVAQQNGIGTLWTSGIDWWIGKRTGNGYNATHGHLAEFCLWYKQLTHDQVKNLACKVRRVPLQIERRSLKFYFPMSAGTGQSITRYADESAAGLTQTLTGTPIGVPDPFSFP